MISFAQGISLAWRYCPITALAAVCLLLFPEPITAIGLIVFIIYSARCGALGRLR